MMDDKSVEEKKLAEISDNVGDGNGGGVNGGGGSMVQATTITPLLDSKTKQSLASIGLLIIGVGIISQFVDRPPKVEKTKIEVIKTIPWSETEITEEGDMKIPRTIEGYYKITKINNGDCTWYKIESSDSNPKEQCFEKMEDIENIIQKIPLQQKEIARAGIIDACFPNQQKR